MGEFSAHKIRLDAGEKVVVATDLQLYVSPNGDDVVNSGIEQGSPFKTPQKAFDFLQDKIISEAGFVTINFASGIYELDEILEIDHPQGERIALVGAEPEVLYLHSVNYYASYGWTAAGFSGFYSGMNHGITINCVRPDSGSTYVNIVEDTPTAIVNRTNGYGVIVEDYDLINNTDYNPTYFYASYPRDPRNNLLRQSSILGCHKLTGVLTGGFVGMDSSIRDEWFLVPMASGMTSWGRYFGNAVPGAYISGNTGITGSLVDYGASGPFVFWNSSVFANNGQSVRQPFHKTIPIGFYGNSILTGISYGYTANFQGVTFPIGTLSAGKTAAYLGTNDQATNELSNQIGDEITRYYSFTGPAGSQLNDSIRFGNNYHIYDDAIGYHRGGRIGSYLYEQAEIPGIYRGHVVNTNRVTVTIIPTVFKKMGHIISVKSGGLRKIKNIFFDGVAMPYFYSLIGPGRMNDTGYSNKCAFYASSSKLGEPVANEPSGLGSGLFSDVGIKDFHVGVYCDKNTNGSLGTVTVSNCSYAVIANKGSSVRTVGSISTGCMFGFAAMNSSSLLADRCFASFSGHSLVELKLKDKAGATFDFSADSFHHGQTYASTDGKIKGTVYDWDSSQKTLTIAVRHGILEGKRLI